MAILVAYKLQDQKEIALQKQWVHWKQKMSLYDESARTLWVADRKWMGRDAYSPKGSVSQAEKKTGNWFNKKLGVTWIGEIQLRQIHTNKYRANQQINESTLLHSSVWAQNCAVFLHWAAYFKPNAAVSLYFVGVMAKSGNLVDSFHVAKIIMSMSHLGSTYCNQD